MQAAPPAVFLTWFTKPQGRQIVHVPKGSWEGGCAGHAVHSRIVTGLLWSASSSTLSCRGVLQGCGLPWVACFHGLCNRSDLQLPSQKKMSGKLLETAVTNGIFLLLFFETSSSKTEQLQFPFPSNLIVNNLISQTLLFRSWQWGNSFVRASSIKDELYVGDSSEIE